MIESSNLSEKTLFLFRHGETDWNREARMQGGTDIALNASGRAQALALRDFFKLNPVDVFLSSDLARARETAEIARGSAGTPIVFDKRLRETDLGDAEGMVLEDVKVKFGPEFYETWKSVQKIHQDVRFPNGESKAEHLARVLGAIEDFLSATSHLMVGVASHGGAIRRLIHHLRPELNDPVFVGNCEIYRVSVEPGGHPWKIDIDPIRR